jgi:hypothetical protein
MNDPCSAEDRQASHDTKSQVPGLLGQRLAARNGDFDFDIAAAQLFDRLAHHGTGHRVDGGLARRDR